MWFSWCRVFQIVKGVLQFPPHSGEVFLISNFCYVPNVVCFLLGNIPSSEFYMPTFWNTLSFQSSWAGRYEEWLGFRNVGVFIQEKVYIGKRRRRPTSIPGHWHLQKRRRLPRSQSISETHPYQYTYTRIHITILLTITPCFPDTQSQSSLWPGFPHPSTRISHHCLQGQWIQPSTGIMNHGTNNTDRQDQ